MQESPNTVITREYPDAYDETKTPFYPIRDQLNEQKYQQYRALASRSRVLFGGRLGSYRYYDMHQVIAQALHAAEQELGEAAPTRRAA